MAEETVDTKNKNSESSPERMMELEQTLAGKETELAELKKSVGELQQELTGARQELGEAISSYKTLIIQANPGMTAELISGDSLKSIDASLEKAKSLVGKVKKSVEKELSLAWVPVGSPGRHSSDLSSLSPREKIHYGIGGKQ